MFMGHVGQNKKTPLVPAAFSVLNDRQI